MRVRFSPSRNASSPRFSFPSSVSGPARPCPPPVFCVPSPTFRAPTCCWTISRRFSCPHRPPRRPRSPTAAVVARRPCRAAGTPSCALPPTMAGLKCAWRPGPFSGSRTVACRTARTPAHRPSFASTARRPHAVARCREQQADKICNGLSPAAESGRVVPRQSVRAPRTRRGLEGLAGGRRTATALAGEGDGVRPG